jgi:hypothetical protein
VALLWSLLMIVVLSRQFQESRSLGEELGRLAAPRAALLTAKIAMDSAARMIGALDVDTRRRTLVMRRLTQAVGGLPDSSFLQSLVIDEAGTGRLTGRARRLPALMTSLEQAGFNASVDGKVTRDSLSGAEWQGFTVALTAASQ